MRRKLYLVAAVLGLLFAGFVVVNRHSISWFLVDSLITATAPLALAALGEGVVLLAGGIDLSVGSVMSLTTVVVASGTFGHGVSCVAAGVGVGLLFGAGNGALCAVMQLPDLMVTLGTGSIAAGLALTVMAVPGGTVPAELSAAASGVIAGIVPWVFIVVLGMGTGLGVLVHRTRLGHHIIASGATRRGASTSGVLVERSRLVAYVIGGAFAGVGGLMLAGVSTSGDPNIGAPYTLNAIAAAVIGGTSLFGGEGSLLGAGAGALVLDVISGILSAMAAPQYLQYVIAGSILVVAVAVMVPREQRAVAIRPMRARLGRRMGGILKRGAG